MTSGLRSLSGAAFTVSLPLPFLAALRISAKNLLNHRVLLHEAGPLREATVSSRICPVLPWALTSAALKITDLRRVPNRRPW